MPDETEDLEDLKKLPPKERAARLKEIREKETEELKKIEQLIERTQNEAEEEEAKTITALKEKEEQDEEEPEEKESLEEALEKEKASKPVTGEQKQYGEQIADLTAVDLREGTENIYDQLKEISNRIKETGVVTAYDRQRIDSFHDLMGDINADYIRDEQIKANMLRADYLIEEMDSSRPKKQKKKEETEKY